MDPTQAPEVKPQTITGGRRSRRHSRKSRGECVGGFDSDTKEKCRKSRRHRGGKSRRARKSRRTHRK